MKRLVDWLNKNHIAVMFALVLLTLVSLGIYSQLPKDVFPNGDFPRFQIIIDIGFASLEETELKVTRPVEEVLKTLPDVAEIRSVTERGTATINVYLKWTANLNEAYQLAQSKLNQIKGELPPNATIDVIRMTTSAFPMSEYGVWSSELSLKELYETVRYSVIPELIGVDGLFGLETIGGEEPEIWVKLDPQKLIEYNLDAATINAAIDQANRVAFVGQVTENENQSFVISGEKLSDAQTIGNVIVATRMGKAVPLKDVATIEEGHAELRRIVSVNGHKGLFIDVRKQQNADGIKVSKELDQKMNEIQKEFNGKLNIVKWDLSDFVQSSIRGILLDIAIGIFIILIIVYWVMNRFRYSLPIMLVLPFVILLEFLLLKIFNQTVNIMTLGGLSAAIGIIADNAIVITENYVRFKTQGQTKNPLVASLSYIVPITLWATLVSIVVFIPLNILSGVPGLFFRPLALTLSSTIILSLFSAVFIIPILIKYFVEGDTGEEQETKILSHLKKGYLKFLQRALHLKSWVVVMNVVLLILGIFIFLKLPTGFLPEWDEGDIVFDYIAPTGWSIESTDKLCLQIEQIIQKIPELKMYVRKTGTHLGSPFAAPTVGEIVILLNEKRKRSTFEVMDNLREDVDKEFPDLDSDFHQILPDRLGDLTGSTKPIVVNVIGNDFEKLQSAAQTVKAELEKIAGLNGVLIDMPPVQKEIKVSTNQDEVSLLGLNLDDVSRSAQLALYGEVISSLQKGLQTIPIREFYEGKYRSDISAIKEIPVYTPNGGVLPLGKLAAYTTVEQNPEIHHKNGVLVVSVTAEISNRPLGDVIKDVKAVLSRMNKDQFSIELAGDYKDQQNSFRELLIVLVISLVLIFAILLFIFESFPSVIAVLLGTLSSTTFVIMGLFLCRTEFDVSSFTGMITVMGIVVNNGILVIHFVDRERTEGKSLSESIYGACQLRFRPVLITNLAAIAGFLPMALNIGHGAEVLGPFSIAMISGLIGSMFFSLVVMPVFYFILHEKKSGTSL